MKLMLNDHSQLLLIDSEGKVQEDWMPVRAFPLSAPQLGVSLLDARSRELMWLPTLMDIPEASRTLLNKQLATHEFQPKIDRILSVSSYATPSRWRVMTDRGETDLLLKGEEHIRRLSDYRYLIAADNGVHFLIEDTRKLDQISRRRLERFL